MNRRPGPCLVGPGRRYQAKIASSPGGTVQGKNLIEPVARSMIASRGAECSDGDGDGTGDGLPDGDSAGELDGVGAGEPDGDGTRVGDGTGERDGDSTGVADCARERDGTGVGARDAASACAAEPDSDGDCVGVRDGESTRDRDGDGTGVGVPDGDGTGDQWLDLDGDAVGVGFRDGVDTGDGDGDGIGDWDGDATGDGDVRGNAISAMIRPSDWSAAKDPELPAYRPVSRSRPVARFAARSCQRSSERLVVKYTKSPAGVITAEPICAEVPNRAAAATSVLRVIAAPAGDSVGRTYTADCARVVAPML